MRARPHSVSFERSPGRIGRIELIVFRLGLPDWQCAHRPTWRARPKAGRKVTVNSGSAGARSSTRHRWQASAAFADRRGLTWLAGKI
ncbi:hypothetical protein BGK67_01245 [Streptomyces subrutilus]|uniref:Uncharacterized protein n=1 Tax=Streptomyces subrutilus TaxID=36818 RepID=A0A1E5PKV9_9ACTN|nr:hypothetical protein BGK67_01245 [Streptomyces subrutilus]